MEWIEDVVVLVVVCGVMVGVGRVWFGLYYSYQEDGLICDYENEERKVI